MVQVDKLCCFLSATALVMDVIACFTPFWKIWESSDTRGIAQGIWARCQPHENSSFTCCVPLKRVHIGDTSVFPEWQQAQVFVVLSLVFGLLTFVLLFHHTRSAVLNYISGALLSAAIFQYCTSVRFTLKNGGYLTFGLSFYTACFSLILFCLAPLINNLYLLQSFESSEMKTYIRKMFKDNFSQSCSYLCVSLGYIFYLLSVATPFWWWLSYTDYNGNEQSVFRGLFGECYKQNGILCCRRLNLNILLNGGTIQMMRMIEFSVFVFGSSSVILGFRISTRSKCVSSLSYIYTNIVIRLIAAALLVTSSGVAQSLSFSPVAGCVSSGLYVLSAMFLLQTLIAEKNKGNEHIIPMQKKDDVCCVCLDRQVDTAFKQCGHNVCCAKCSKKIIDETGTCPICRESVLPETPE